MRSAIRSTPAEGLQIADHHKKEDPRDQTDNSADYKVEGDRSGVRLPSFAVVLILAVHALHVGKHFGSQHAAPPAEFNRFRSVSPTSRARRVASIMGWPAMHRSTLMPGRERWWRGSLSGKWRRSRRGLGFSGDDKAEAAVWAIGRQPCPILFSRDVSVARRAREFHVPSMNI